MNRAFVTGASGFIGSHLVRRLLADGVEVRALARSDSARSKIAELGAKAVPGDLQDPASLAAGASGCDVAFHCAAMVESWGPREEFVRSNVIGTRNALHACRVAGIARFVHVSTVAAVFTGRALKRIDEEQPLRPGSRSRYTASKARGELLVRVASVGGLETVVVRPGIVWGPGDNTIMPSFLHAVRRGRYAWVSGGHHETFTSHVDNITEGLIRAARRGAPGAAYFVSDEETITFRRFITELLATQGVEIRPRSMPRALARAMSVIGEPLHEPLSSPPVLSRAQFWVAGLEITLDTTLAREQLGYRPVRTIAEGMAELRRLALADDAAANSISPSSTPAPEEPTIDHAAGIH